MLAACCFCEACLLHWTCERLQTIGANVTRARFNGMKALLDHCRVQCFKAKFAAAKKKSFREQLYLVVQLSSRRNGHDFVRSDVKIATLIRDTQRRYST